MFSILTILGAICIIWWLAILSISLIGHFEIMNNFNSIKRKPENVKLDAEGLVMDDDLLLEGVTILRPIKGIDPDLEKCLESCLLQNYPSNKFQVIFCVEDPNDPSIPIVLKLLKKHQGTKDCQLLIESANFGPNPKVNNLAKGYKAAKFDIIWVLDSNVWVNPGTLVRSVISLRQSLDNGKKTTDRPVKLVHHVPIAVNEPGSNATMGAKLDEMFLLTSHAKFYVFFNKASIDSCVNGKSNLYRRSSLDECVNKISQGQLSVTSQDNSSDAREFIGPGEGLRFFSRYIGEDNMIGIGLWRLGGRQGMTGDVAVQPMNNNKGADDSSVNLYQLSVSDYVKRRVRWLRVRKYMVLAATLVEPTTESIVIGLMGCSGLCQIVLNSFDFFWWLFALHECVWCYIDFSQFTAVVNFANVDELAFKSNNDSSQNQIGLNKHIQFWSEWLPIWLLRELLALPIWIIAMCGGTIDWRNKPFKINSDLSAVPL
ncbi:hypothetical protein WICPIJ_000901 [Wickerhamomyces pijperi]|uniref:Ceramide glucosyltransferase n=1 Tax=Wickerhamomyces pijperi TaxID=599730 RepID=A0A9P8TRA1_WICPI|nr:hypothetical protein WICPIJ_000901 [Wickerhamomyces pijperi]